MAKKSEKKKVLPKKESPTEKEKPKRKEPFGRPTIFTEELAERICKLVATTPHGLRKLCKMFDWLPDQDTINVWRYEKPNFSGQYAVAKIKQADLLAEDCIDIADDDSRDIKITENGYEAFDGEFAARSRLRVDTRKWLASKLLPKQYGGDALLQQTREENTELKEELKVLRARLDSENKKDY